MTKADRSRRALVTGAARGIGAATALALAAEGYNVLAVDIDADGLAETARQASELGYRIDTAIMDVRSTEDVEKVVGEAQARAGGGFDLLVNNAGFASIGYLDEISDEHWSEVLNLNLMSMMRVTREVAPAMRKRDYGCIICLSSVAGYRSGWPGRLAYSAAKAGVAGLVKTLAMELAPAGVRVNGIAPSGLHAAVERVPLGRKGTPEDIADAICLLASSKARFITGQTIHVDGGMSAAL